MRLIDGICYYVYIVTNEDKTIFYTGLTKELALRLYQHEHDVWNNTYQTKSDDGCIHLVYWERLENLHEALTRESYIKGLNTKKRQLLISKFNPGWEFLNSRIDTQLP